MNVSETPGLTDRVADHLAAADFAALSGADVARAKQRLLDSIGNIAAGAQAAGSAEVLGLVRRWGGAAEATPLTAAERVPALHAAFANAVLMRSYDFEAIGADSPGGAQIPSHITGTTVSVALAVAEARRRSGREMLTALVYGDDLAARLGHATGFDVYGGGDNTGTINALGATATAGLLLGLDQRQLRDALGLAVNQLGGTIANVFDKVLAFKLPIALSARNAVFSAELAATGFSGPEDALGGPFGYLRRYGKDSDPAKVTDRLGLDFYADAVIKPWPSCRASHPTLDGVLRIVSEHDIAADDVERVLLHVTPRTKAGFVGQPFAVGDSPEVSGAFSILFTAATALLDRTLELRHMGEPHMSDPRLAEMMSRVELVDSLPPDEILTAEVELRTRDGEHYRVRVDHPLGDLHVNPLGDERVEAKFRSNIEWGGLPEDRADRLIELIDYFEALDDVSEIARLLA